MSEDPSRRLPHNGKGNEQSDRERLEQKILAHAKTLLMRQLPDLAYAKKQFAVYDRQSFKKSFNGSTSVERDLANRVAGAFDDVMNGLNEVLRSAYCLEHGYRRIGPAMPVVYTGLSLAHSAELEWINDARNDLTHDYPVAEASRMFDAVEELGRVIVRTLRDVHAFTSEHGLTIPGIDDKR
jgi:hypothetical protein